MVWFSVLATVTIQIITNSVDVERSMSDSGWHIMSFEILRVFCSVAAFTTVFRLHIRTVSADFLGIILLTIFLFSSKFMRTVNFNIFLLSSYALSHGMLLLLGTITEPFFHNTPSAMMSHFPEPVLFPEKFCPFKMDFNFGKS